MAGNLGLLQPVHLDTVRQGGMLLLVHPTPGTLYSVAAKPDTAAISAGWSVLGVLKEAPDMEVGAEREVVEVGALGLVAGSVIRRIRGGIKGSLLGFDLDVLARACGSTPLVTLKVSPTASTTASAITVDTVTNNHKFTATSVTGFLVGMTIQVGSTSNPNTARIADVTGSVLTLDRQLKSTPASGAAFGAVDSVSTLLGTNNVSYFALAGIVNFPIANGQTEGTAAVVRFPKVFSKDLVTMKFGAGTDPIETPFAFEAIGGVNAAGQVYAGDMYEFPNAA